MSRNIVSTPSLYYYHFREVTLAEPIEKGQNTRCNYLKIVKIKGNREAPVHIVHVLNAKSLKTNLIRTNIF